MLSCPLILGTKRCMLCCLLVFGGPKCENHVRGFASSVRFVNMQRTAHRHPQVFWNHYPLLIGGLDLWSMDFITRLPLCANGCNAHFHLCRLFDQVHCLNCMYFRGRGN